MKKQTLTFASILLAVITACGNQQQDVVAYTGVGKAVITPNQQNSTSLDLSALNVSLNESGDDVVIDVESTTGPGVNCRIFGTKEGEKLKIHNQNYSACQMLTNEMRYRIDSLQGEGEISGNSLKINLDGLVLSYLLNANTITEGTYTLSLELQKQ